MQRYLVAILLGGLAGLLFDAFKIITFASYPELPRTLCYRSGSDAIALLQDQLMDREVALYLCKGLAADGFDFFVNGVFAGVVLLAAYDRIGDCWLRKSIANRLVACLRSKYAIGAYISFTIFMLAIYTINPRCFFLCTACIFNPFNSSSFILSGVLPVCIWMLLRKLRRNHLNSLQLFIHVLLIALCSSMLCNFWPDLMNPVAENTGLMMNYNQSYWGLVPCGTQNSDSLICLISDSVIVLFFAFVSLETSRCVLAKHVFEPLLTTLFTQPSFNGWSKAAVLLALILGLNYKVADALANGMPNYYQRHASNDCTTVTSRRVLFFVKTPGFRRES